MNCSVYILFCLLSQQCDVRGFLAEFLCMFLCSSMEHYSHHIVHTNSHLSVKKRSFLGHEFMKWCL